VVKLTCPASTQCGPALSQDSEDQSTQFTAPPLMTDPQQLALDPAHAPMLALDQAHEPSTAHAPSAVHEPLVTLESAHVPLASVSTVHEPSPTTHVSSRPFFHPGVCANTQLLGGAADVNNIYVPLHAFFLASSADKFPPSFTALSSLHVLC